MSVLENFKNIPRSPYRGRQGSNVIFFLQIRNEVPGEKKRGPVARWRQGPVARWGGRQGPFPLYKPWPPFLLSFEPKNSEKREG